MTVAYRVNVHMYLIKISQVDDRELFKVCLEYWSKLVKELYDEQQSIPTDMGPLMGIGLNLVGGGGGGNSAHFGGGELHGRKLLYRDVCSNLRLVFIEKMVKPEEVCQFHEVACLSLPALDEMFMDTSSSSRFWWSRTMKARWCANS